MLFLLDLDTWTRWDQSHYLEIAASGYRAFPCTQESGFNQGDWCGNASWFPFYPLLIRAVFQLFHRELNPALIGLVISNLFFFVSLFYVLPLLSEDLGCQQKSGNIIFRTLLFIFFPSSIFFHANYPLSLALCAAGLSLHLVYRHKPLISIPLTLISCISYPPMVLLSLPLALYGLNMVAQRKLYGLKPLQILCWLLCASTPYLSYLAAQLYIDLNTGVSNSFTLVGEKYGHGIYNPFYAFKSVLIRVSQFNDFSSVQTTFLSLILFSIAATVVLRFIICKFANHNQISLFGLDDLSLFSFACLCIVLPMIVGGAVSTYRTESLSAIAIVVLIDKFISIKFLKVFFLVAAGTLYAVSTNLFLEGRLV